MAYVIPITTAIIGLLGGLLVGLLKARSDIKIAKQQAAQATRTLALEIVKMEFGLASAERRVSAHSVVSHIAVLERLLTEHNISIESEDIGAVIKDLTETYKQQCWGEIEALDGAREWLEGGRKTPPSAPLRNPYDPYNKKALPSGMIENESHKG